MINTKTPSKFISLFPTWHVSAGISPEFFIKRGLAGFSIGFTCHLRYVNSVNMSLNQCASRAYSSHNQRIIFPDLVF